MPLKNVIRKRKKLLFSLLTVTVIAVVLLLVLSKKTIITDPKISIFASSSQNRKSNARKAIDNNKSTAWIAKSAKSGVYEWIKIVFSQPIKISGIKIINGYTKKSSSWGDYYEKYNRLRTARIAFSDYLSYYVKFKDNERDFQSFKLPSPRTTSSIQFFVHTVYRGTWKDQLAISEIQFW